MSMPLRAGYKQTEIGVIPEDWDVKQLGEIGRLSKGKGLLKEDLKTNGAVPAIPYTALYTDFSELLDYERIKWFIDDTTKTIVLSEPCVLIASSSNMAENTGKASALTRNTPVAIGREVIVFRSDYCVRYISYLLSTPSYRKRTLVLARGTTIKHLYPATFIDYKISLPSICEQEAIAEALSDADALIRSLEHLCEKKRRLKQGTMGELLTGKRRLPGFGGEWEVTRLGAVIERFVGGGTPSRSNPQYWGGDIPWVTVKDFATFTPRHSQESITRAGLHNSASHLVPKGVLITSTRMALGRAVIYEVDVAINQDLKALFPSPVLDTQYLYFWFQYQESFIDELGSGSTVKGISLLDLKKIQFQLPPRTEQSVIAALLSDMDAEIAELEAQLTKARTIKQGMVHNLLTGKIRLI